MDTTTIVIVVVVLIAIGIGVYFYLSSRMDDSQLRPIWKSSKWQGSGENPFTLTFYTLGDATQIHMDYSRPGIIKDGGASVQNMSSGIGLFEVKSASGLKWSMEQVTGVKHLDFEVSADKKTLVVKDANPDKKLSFDLSGTYAINS